MINPVNIYINIIIKSISGPAHQSRRQRSYQGLGFARIMTGQIPSHPDTDTGQKAVVNSNQL